MSRSGRLCVRPQHHHTYFDPPLNCYPRLNFAWYLSKLSTCNRVQNAIISLLDVNSRCNVLGNCSNRQMQTTARIELRTNGAHQFPTHVGSCCDIPAVLPPGLTKNDSEYPPSRYPHTVPIDEHPPIIPALIKWRDEIHSYPGILRKVTDVRSRFSFRCVIVDVGQTERDNRSAAHA